MANLALASNTSVSAVEALGAQGLGGPADLERSIHEIEEVHGAAIGRLRQAVVEFRSAFGKREDATRVLVLAWQVAGSLRSLRNIERSLRVLSAERRTRCTGF